ncbi:MAG: tetratricopeptide repeat protein [Nitrospirota bacterium]
MKENDTSNLSTKHLLIVSILIISVSIIIYRNSLNNTFHYDDFHSITDNRYIKDMSNIPLFFISTHYFSSAESRGRHYRPVLLSSYTINYYLGGLNPYGYRVVNISLHILISFMLYLVVAIIFHNNMAALCASLIFAANPFNSEVINYISARSSLLSTLFYILSFLLFLLIRNSKLKTQNSKLKKISLYLSFYLSFVMAMLSKEIAITLPIILVIYDIFFYQRKKGSLDIKMGIIHLPFFIGGIVYILIFKVHTFLFNILTGHGARSFYSNMLVQSKVLIRYIQLFLFPINLSIDHYIRIPTSILDMPVLFSIIMLSLIFLSGFISYKKMPAISFFILWFFITFLPTTVIPLNILLFENRGYLPCLAFAAISGISIAKLSSLSTPCNENFTKKAVFFLFIILILSFSIGGITRNKIWKDEFTLWKDVLKKTSDSFKAHASLGLAYHEKGDYESAIREYKEAINISPGYFIPYISVGTIYHEQGDLDMAIKYYQDALKIDSHYSIAHYNLGIAYHNRGEVSLAIKEYKETIKTDPYNFYAHYNLGDIYSSQGKTDMAIKELNETVRVNPDFANAYYNLASEFDKTKRYKEAVEHYQKFIKIADAGRYSKYVREAKRRIREIKKGDHD